MKRLSVVIPTYDTAAMTLRCCRAVRASLPAESEVIVVDDGSRDGTSELLADEARVIRLERNSGFAVAANRGVEASAGRIILLLNSDALVEPRALQAFLDAFDRDPTLGVAGARLLHADGTPQWSGGPTPTLPWMLAVITGLGSLKRGQTPFQANVDWVSGAAMAVRREAWSPLDERYLFYCQDIDLCLRARDAGWDVRIVENARVRHDIGGTIANESPLRHDPERLWPDLLTWGTARYGRTWSRFARVALVTGAYARVVANWLRRSATTKTLARAARRLAQSEA